MEVSAQVLEFLTTLAWPIIVLVALVLFRKPLGSILERIINISLVAGTFKLETSLRRYVSPGVLSELKKNPRQYNLAGERRTVTILYSEIKGFTPIHEGLLAQDAALYINRYLTHMTEIIFQLGGTLHRYEGTDITAYWGAPIAYEDSSERACDAALKMNEAVNDLSPELEELGGPPLLPIIGITTAEVIVGNLGSDQQPDYSILGDFQSILVRLAKLNYNFQTRILVTDYTHPEIKDKFKTRLLAEKLTVKGKTEPVGVYELLSREGNSL